MCAIAHRRIRRSRGDALHHPGKTAFGHHFFTSGHSLSDSGLAASSGEIFATSL